MSNALIGHLQSALDVIDTEGFHHRTSFHEGDILTVQAMEKALEAARLLCANLQKDGQGHMTLVNNFLTLDAEIK